MTTIQYLQIGRKSHLSHEPGMKSAPHAAWPRSRRYHRWTRHTFPAVTAKVALASVQPCPVSRVGREGEQPKNAFQINNPTHAFKQEHENAENEKDITSRENGSLTKRITLSIDASIPESGWLGSSPCCAPSSFSSKVPRFRRPGNLPGNYMPCGTSCSQVYWSSRHLRT